MGSRIRAAWSIAGPSSRPATLVATSPLQPTTPACSARRTLTHSSTLCSGSNKWSKIKHVKLAKDAQKGTNYGTLSREIISCVRQHPTRSTSPETNPRLALLFKKAKLMSVTKEKLEATLKKAESHGLASSDGTAVTYEVLGPTSTTGVPVALIVECQTDSVTRTLLRVRESLTKSKSDMRLAQAGHMFQRHGIIRLITRPDATFDSVFEAAVENGAEDVREWDAEQDNEGDENADESPDTAARGMGIEVVCDRATLKQLTTVLSSEPHGHTIVESDVKMLPTEPPVLIREEEEAGEEADDTSDQELGLGSGWLSNEVVTKLERTVDALYENADCTQIW